MSKNNLYSIIYIIITLEINKKLRLILMFFLTMPYLKYIIKITWNLIKLY